MPMEIFLVAPKFIHHYRIFLKDVPIDVKQMTECEVVKRLHECNPKVDVPQSLQRMKEGLRS